MAIGRCALEDLELTVPQSGFGNARVLVTGHTGFKGSWLALWLQSSGAEVVGLALPPESKPNHWDCLALDIEQHHVDIRDAAALDNALTRIAPDFVFHLAAQALVRRSFRDPIVNWQTNLMGTVNLLEACRRLPALAGVVVVTTDKCYENREWNWGYRENDRLGGHDPYSASKACAELAVSSYRNSFYADAHQPLIASVRAGNVIGGGDWSEDRLLPDVFRAVQANRPLQVRFPGSTRPWQHVLEAVAGYVTLGERLLAGDASCARAWNFGPRQDSNRSVVEVLEGMKRYWPAFDWEPDDSGTPHEAARLYLDSSDARELLGWRNVWGFQQMLENTADWYRTWFERGEILSAPQLQRYRESLAEDKR